MKNGVEIERVALKNSHLQNILLPPPHSKNGLFRESSVEKWGRDTESSVEKWGRDTESRVEKRGIDTESSVEKCGRNKTPRL